MKRLWLGLAVILVVVLGLVFALQRHAGRAGKEVNVRASRVSAPLNAKRPERRVTAPVPGTPIRQLNDMQRATFRQIAAQYAANARFPPWSVPLNAQQWTLLHPNASIPVRVPLQLPAGRAELAVVLAHATLFSDQPIKVRASLSASPDTLAGIDRVEARILTLSGRVLDHFAMQASSLPLTGTRNFKGQLAADSTRDWPRSLRVQVSVEVNGNLLQVLAPFRYQKPQAILETVGPAYVNGANLVIPLHFEHVHAGYYRIQANLLDARLGIPVAHLVSNGQLDFGGDGLVLRCHVSVLKAQRAPGPYRLSGFLIEHMPDRPGTPTLLGRSAKTSYPVRGFPLSDYADRPYRNLEVQARLRFLRRLGSPNRG